jgi:hypothetical protein
LTKSLNTLVADIYQLFDPNQGHIVNEDNLEYFTETLKSVIRTGLALREPRDFYLRFSALGKPDRQLWYEAHDYPKEELNDKTYFKFLYGHVIEALIIFLAKEAGHEITDEQKEVSCLGVKGHIDCKIDGVVVDVKSASPYGFQKFKDHSLLEKDPFGYVQQLSGYVNEETPGEAGAFLAVNKVNGDITVMDLSTSIVQYHPPGPRIEHLREVISLDTPPVRCYPDKPEGKSGNRSLGTECSYCAYNVECWPGLRTFIYSTGPKYLTKVVETPRVYEAT